MKRNITKLFWVLGAALTFLLSSTGALQASFIVPGSSGWTVGGNSPGHNITVGDTFTASQTGQLSEITVLLSYAGGANSATISLRSDAGGTPGGVLESWNVVNLPIATTPTTVTDMSNVALTAGTNYWVVISTTSGSTLTWQYNNTGPGGAALTGSHATSYDGGATWSASNNTQGTFSVAEGFAPELLASTPEPSTFVLFAIGLGVLAGNKLRRRRA